MFEFATDPEQPDNPNLALRQGQLRVFKTQLILCLWIGIFSFGLFCVLRRKWPHMYAVRTLRTTNSQTIKILPGNLLTWIKTIYNITDDEVLEYSGLDAYVFLSFFKMGIKIFSLLSILDILILSPIRYYYTGNYDKDNITVSVINSITSFNLNTPHTQFKEPPDLLEEFPYYFWVYPIFTYLFSIIVYVKLFDYTKKVLKTRQKYLASQNSITDRTIRLDGIPKRLLKKNNPVLLKNFIEDLQIGKVLDVRLIYDYTPLEELFEKRNALLVELERKYSSTYGLNIDLYNEQKTPGVFLKNEIDTYQPSDKKFRKARKKITALFKSLNEVNDKIRFYQDKFDPKDNTIDIDKYPEFKLLPTAFITMDSVAAAQMAAQTILDPRVYKLMVSLAPAAKDIKWQNFKLTYYEKLFKSYLITFLIIFSYIFVSLLVTPLSTLLDLKTITKVWPQLGELIKKSQWATTFVTGVLPPFLFSLLNILLPYFYQYLSQFQGYSSNSDIELSTLLKNFFFIFFNLFLVFIVSGTIWDYISSISDTTKIATQLATSLKKLSLFYVDLILLQGLAMFPVKLLQIGDFVILNIIGKLLFLKSIILRTPRDYRFYYYTPPVFDFGIHLPQHILIFIIILIYSVVSTKIVTSGLAYFVLGFFVYKYQLIYSFVHPPHSTGKVWPMIFRRIILGLVLFQLFMCGTLALEGAILLSILCSPLLLVTLIISYNYEKYYLPLNNFIALKAILNPLDFDKEFDDDVLLVSISKSANNSSTNINQTQSPDEGQLLLHHLFEESTSLLLAGDHTAPYNDMMLTSDLRKRRVSTIDEDREKFTDYTYPFLIDPLNGPWIGFEGDFISMVEYRCNYATLTDDYSELETGDISVMTTTDEELILRKRLRVSEWE